MSLGSGTRLGPYEIQSAIGAGGMGEVYRARDTRLQRDVAVKVLPAGLSSDPDRLARFEQEARAAAALNHPNILAVYDVSQHDGAPYLISELLEGGSLREQIAHGPVPMRKAVDWATQIARGLAAAHEKGIVHRDLKPENIFITTDGRAKILDFGLAKLTQPDAALAQASMLPTTPGHTVAGVILGTVGYMAPEQVRGLPADHRSDIFAFGAVLYEMLCGQRAFQGETMADSISAILDRHPPDLPLAERHIPPGLARIVERCLEKHSTARFQTASDLAFALESLSSHSDVASRADVTRRRSAFLSRRRLFAAGTSFLLGAAATAAAMIYYRPASPEPLATHLDVVSPPTTDPFSFALSPDGRQLVFVANGEKGSQLWVRSLDQGEARPLAATEGATYPFWAPDNRAIGFFADEKLKRLDLAGSAPQVLADAPLGRGGTWNAEGAIVFAPTTGSPLMRVMAAGGPVEALTTLGPGEGSHRWPQFLPGGRRILFLMTLGQPQTHGTYVVGLDGPQPARVVSGETAALFAPPGFLLRASQGVLVAQRFDAAGTTVGGDPVPVAQRFGIDDGTYRSAFSVSDARTLAYRVGAGALRQLVWLDRAGKVLERIGTPDPNTLGGPSLTRDGQRVVVNRTVEGNFDLWLLDVGRRVFSRFTFEGSLESYPIWSPDGRRVVFSSSRKGAADLFEKSVTGGTDEQPVLLDKLSKVPQDWSSDGRYILYAVLDSTNANDLWALPTTGDRKPFPVAQTRFEEMAGQFSPDARWVAYTSTESGRAEIYVRPFPGAGAKWQVSTAGGNQARWRRDGRELFYIAPDGRLMAVPIRLVSEESKVDVGMPVPLFATHIATGAAIGSITSAALAEYDVAADGRFLMNVAIDEAVTSPIEVVLNWTAGLKK